MDGLMTYRPGPIAPIAQVGDNVLLSQRRTFEHYRIAFIESLPLSHALVVDAGAIAAGITANAVNPQLVLDLATGQLGHYRAHVLDDIHVQINQPAATARMSNRNVTARISAFTHLEDPYDAQAEFFILEDQRFFLLVTNPTGYALTQARVAFYGFRYVLEGRNGSASGKTIDPIQRYDSIEAAKQSGLKFAVVPVGGWDR